MTHLVQVSFENLSAPRTRQAMIVSIKPNIRWSMDFVSDQFANGRRFRILNVVDDHSREVLGQLRDIHSATPLAYSAIELLFDSDKNRIPLSVLTTPPITHWFDNPSIICWEYV